EGSGILNWMLQGLQAYRDAKGLAIPNACSVATANYRIEQDPIVWFVETRCRKGDDFMTPTGTLYAAFRVWFDGKGIPERMPSNIVFGKALSRLGFPSVLAGTERLAHRSGIELLPEPAAAVARARTPPRRDLGDADDD